MSRQHNLLRHLECVLATLVLASAMPAFGQGATAISGTRHNLTVSGPGPIRVAGETEVCKFCHTPHASNPIAPLWNRADTGQYYQTYASSTLKAQVGQPSGSSRLCLSCHDGTIALTQTYNSRNAIAGTVYISPQDKGYLGTDLSDDHPISFEYTSSLSLAKGQLRDPSSLPLQLRLDKNQQLQCTTCHDPHSDQYGKFLRMDNGESAMCRTCHLVDGWANSSHATSSASLGASRMDTWSNLSATTVRQAACESCHRPHSAGGRQRLLRHDVQSDNCLTCHDGTVSRTDLTAEMTKFSAHPVGRYAGVHDPGEDPRSMTTHVDCADCHDPHLAASGTGSLAPKIQTSMQGASGFSLAGSSIPNAQYEYQVCYKCHTKQVVSFPLVQRVLDNPNLAEKFSLNSPSYHPVEGSGKNSSVPSLLLPLRTTSVIYCTDCHRSDSGLKGPHGSRYRPILVRRYEVGDNTVESPDAYALCYGCHNRDSILGDQSFPKHHAHIQDVKAPCSACHDAHGVSSTQSNVTTGSHLINFDRIIVQPSQAAGSGPTYNSTGLNQGSCTLLCHGKDHVNMTYGGAARAARPAGARLKR